MVALWTVHRSVPDAVQIGSPQNPQIVASLQIPRGRCRKFSTSNLPSSKDHRQRLRHQTSRVVALGRQKQWEKALEVVSGGGFAPDVKLLTALCGALERASAWQQVLRLHGEWSQHVTLDERFLGLATSACAKGRQWQRALQLAMETGFERLETANAVLSSLDHCGEWQLALELLYHVMPAADVVSYSSVVSAMARAARWPEAIAVLHMEGADEVTFGAAISACDRGHQWERACALLHDMPQHVSLVAMNSALSACGRGHQWEMACQLIQDMEHRSFQPDVVSYTTTVTSCNRSRQWLKALELYHLLRNGQSSVNLVLYSAALKACQLGTHWQQAMLLFQEMQDVGRWPDIAAFNPCLGALVESKKWEEALALVVRMPSLALQPNSATKRLLLRASGNHWQGSLEIMLARCHRCQRCHVLVHEVIISFILIMVCRIFKVSRNGLLECDFAAHEGGGPCTTEINQCGHG